MSIMYICTFIYCLSFAYFMTSLFVDTDVYQCKFVIRDVSEVTIAVPAANRGEYNHW